MKNYLFIIFCLIFASQASSQFVMSNATINTCSGTIADAGGAGANYGNSENFELIICPDVAGSQISLDFTTFALEDSYDFLTVYNGVGTGNPTLGTYTGVNGPGFVQSSSPSGCITLVFTSDGSFNDVGFLANISCSQPCQDVISNATPNPGFSSATFVDICQGDNIQFTGNGGYPQNGTSYAQSDATSTFDWSFGDGGTGTGQVVNHVYNTPGIYQVDLDMTDVNGCPNINDIDVVVRVSPDPVFTGSNVTNPVICLGETNTLTGAVTPSEIILNCTPPVAGTIALPDGSGVSYSTAITVDCFNPGQTITSAADIDDICFDMEHSYAGDLNIAIECPDGTIVELVDYGGFALGNQFIGEPVDNTTGDIGTPYTYCFDNVSGTTWEDAALAGSTYTYTDNSGVTHTNQSYIPGGAYQPIDPLSGLVGCPLNGDWSIVITDNLAADDGYIFSWTMNFNPSIVPPTLSDTPAITSEGWQADPTITNTSGSTITVQPNASGPACYTYEATDEYGCTYDTTICFTVLPPSDPSCPSCFITNFEVNAFLGNCETVWDVDGIVEFIDEPATGDLIFEDCNGTQTVIASAPFSSPVVYNMSSLPATLAGGNCEFEVFFSDAPTCTQAVTINLPGYTPPDEAGTVTATLNGNSINDFIVCDGDNVDIIGDGNSSIPPIAPGNDPSIIYFVYSCPPSPGGPGIDPLADPCFEGLVMAPGVNFTNNGGSNAPLLTGFSNAAVDGIFYVVPMTLGSLSGGTYNPDCYDLALDQLVTIQYLNPIIPVIVEDCQAGEATVTITGGYPEYYGGDYTISNLLPASASLSTTNVAHGGDVVISGLTDGDNYSFDITDANGCPETISGTFTGLEDPSFSYPATTYCIDAADPAATITGDAGGTFSSTPGLSLNTGNGAIDLSASTPGTYTVTYTTADPVCFDSETFDITINPLPIVTAVNNGPMCIGQNVDITAGGADSYTWDNGLGAGITHNVSPAATTNYTVTGTDINGCVNTASTNVVVNPLPNVNAGVDQEFCIGPNATLAGSGAATYAWDNGVVDGVAFTPPVGTTTYTVTGTDANGCINTDQVDVTVNPLPTIDAGADDAICVGGNTTLTAIGGATYSWDNGLGAGNGFVVSPAITTTYTVTGTDVNGCVNTDQVQISVLATAPIDAGLDVMICDGENTTLTATGGVTYTWDNGLGAGNDFIVSPAATTTYTVNGTDANGCTGTDQIQVTVNPLPVVTAGPDQTECDGTAITLNGGGASSYAWDNGVTDGVAFNQVVGTVIYTVTGTDVNNCVNTDQVSVTINALPVIDAGVDQTECEGTMITLTGAGAPTLVWDNGVNNGVAFNQAPGTVTYTVTGTDANNCVNTDQVDVTINANPIVNAGLDQSECDGTAITLSGSGADSYVWDNGVTDGVPFNQAVGTVVYNVTGTDVNNCTGTDQVSVTINPNPSPVISGAFQYCTGTQSVLNAGPGFDTYLWSNGANTQTASFTDVDNPITVTVTFATGCSGTSPAVNVVEDNFVITNEAYELCQGEGMMIHGNFETTTGTYSQQFVASNGCDSISNVDLLINPLPPVDAGIDQEECDGVATTLTASGAVNYVWDNGVTNGVTFNQAIGTITYTVTGTDGNGCENTDQVDVTINPLPTVDAGTDFAICAGDQATLTGTGAANYVWNNGVTDGVAFNPAATNTYTVTGTDANNCVNTDQITVTVNSLPVVNAGPDQIECEGTMITLSGSGATSYVWDNGVTNGVAFVQAPGLVTYTVTGTDGNNCVNTDQVDVTINANPIVDAGVDQTVCDGIATTVSGSGANSYVWDNGVTNNIAFNQAVGTITYTVTGTDVNNCVGTDQMDITVNALPIVNAGPDQVVCEGTAVTLSGAGAVNYVWNNGVTDGVPFVPAVGSIDYTVTGTDANNCSSTDVVNVTVNPLPNVFAGNDLTICDGEQIVLTGSGADNYVWDNGVTDGALFTPGATQTYTVTGTTAAGCVGTDDVTVTVEPAPTVSFAGDVLSGCAPLTVRFTNNTGVNSDLCEWTFSDGTTTVGCDFVNHTFTNPGCYDVTLEVTTLNGCTNTTTLTDYICVDNDPIASFEASETQLTNTNTNVNFSNTSIGATTYEWTFGDGSAQETSEHTQHEFPDDEFGSYVVELVAISAAGCTDTARQVIEVVEELIFYVPNTFTPDNDDFNPTFSPVFTSGFDPFDYTLLIFDRWGELIFESHDATVGWDGTYGIDGELVKEGTYVWKIEFKTNMNDERKVRVGHVNLLK